MIKLKTINNGKSPIKSTALSAGYDLFANEDIYTQAGETKLLGLGVCIESCPENYYLELHPRSSLRLKGFTGGVGIIDADYRGEIKLILSSNTLLKINKGDKVAQIIPRENLGLVIDAPILENERKGGFGSTGG